MLSRKIFENLHAVMAICNAFSIILRQILFKFFDPDSECFAKYDAFGAHIFDYACLRRRLFALEEVRSYGKTVYIKNYFENGWWEDACLSF